LNYVDNTVTQRGAPPTFMVEKQVWEKGYTLIAGIDEVGRGPLAGPVVAGAVILPKKPGKSWITQVRDSKELTEKKRETLADIIKEKAVAWGIGIVPPEEIDNCGIIQATRKAMMMAVEKLESQPQFLIIDAMKLPDLNLPQRAIIRGDKLCLSIACASIVAKVARDKMMMDYEKTYPGYGFGKHKGYGTPEHMLNIQKLGPCPIHRRSFSWGDLQDTDVEE
jgi:ribonuclease HII